MQAKALIGGLAFLFLICLSFLAATKITRDAITTESSAFLSSDIAKPIVVIGDSNSLGMTRCKLGQDGKITCEILPEPYITKLSKLIYNNKKIQTSITNLSKGGTTLINGSSGLTYLKNKFVNKTAIAPGLISIDPSNLTIDPTSASDSLAKGEYSSVKNSLVFVAYGRNDPSFTTHSPEVFRDKLNALIIHLKSNNNSISLLQLPPIDVQKYNNTFPNTKLDQGRVNERDSQINSVISEVAQKNNLDLINIYTLIQSNNISEDGIHLNQSGHDKLSEFIFSKLTSISPELSSCSSSLLKLEFRKQNENWTESNISLVSQQDYEVRGTYNGSTSGVVIKLTKSPYGTTPSILSPNPYFAKSSPTFKSGNYFIQAEYQNCKSPEKMVTLDNTACNPALLNLEFRRPGGSWLTSNINLRPSEDYEMRGTYAGSTTGVKISLNKSPYSSTPSYMPSNPYYAKGSSTFRLGSYYLQAKYNNCNSPERIVTLY